MFNLLLFNIWKVMSGLGDPKQLLGDLFTAVCIIGSTFQTLALH